MTKVVDFLTRGPQERWIVLHTRDEVPSDRLHTRFAIADSKAEVFDLVLEMAGAGKWDVEKWECQRRERGEEKRLRYPDMDHDELIYELRQLGAIGDDQFEAVHYEVYERRRDAYPEVMESYRPEARNDNAAGAARAQASKPVDYQEVMRRWRQEQAETDRQERQRRKSETRQMWADLGTEVKVKAKEAATNLAIGMATTGILGTAARWFM